MSPGSIKVSAPIRIFRSQNVLTPEGVRPASVVTQSGSILSVEPWELKIADAEIHDFDTHHLLPGLVDTHVHINDPGRDWEGFETATRAAAAGGVTTLVDMPLNSLPETLTVAALAAKRSAAAGNCHVDWAPWGGIVGNQSAPDNLAQIPLLAAQGLPGFKAFLIHSGIDSFAWTDESRLRQALAVLRGTGLPLLAHAELSQPIIEASSRLTKAGADWRQYATYLASRPDISEVAAIELLIRLAADYQIPIHIVHLATAQALPAIRRAREAGIPITVETCPHYLWFAAEEVPEGATQYKCAPPIRSAATREALWQALDEGVIDFIATDHSPCPPSLKWPDPSDSAASSSEVGRRHLARFDQAWGGIATLGLTLPLLWTMIRNRRGDNQDCYADLGRWLATAPAHLAGLSGKKGQIAPGHDADFAVFNPGLGWTVTESDLHFRHKISPYLGAQVHGRVLETWLRGDRIYRFHDGAANFPGPPRGLDLSLRSPQRTQADPHVGAAGRVIAECRLLATFTEEPGRTTRRFLSRPIVLVHDHLRRRMTDLGMTVSIDAIGNLRGLWMPPTIHCGKTHKPRLILGSHIDTVPNAGAFDGVLGVILALEWLAIAQQANFPRPIEIVAFSEEEGVRFKTPFLGSRALAGTFDPALLDLTDADRISMRDAIVQFGLDPARIPEAALTAADLAGPAQYIEIHIEQGPVLDSENIPVAVVELIKSQMRMRVRFVGQANHAGTTPMELRHDALAAAAQWMTEVEALAKSAPAAGGSDGMVATIGSIAVEPGASNIIPGLVELTLDIRCRQRMSPTEDPVRTLIHSANRTAKERGVAFEFTVTHNLDQATMDMALSAELGKAVEDAGFPLRQIDSGAGHDAMILADKIPCAMLFLRTPMGLSHHPAETVHPQDIAACLKIGERFFQVTIRE